LQLLQIFQGLKHEQQLLAVFFRLFPVSKDQRFFEALHKEFYVTANVEARVDKLFSLPYQRPGLPGALGFLPLA
jgi:hypothetical protein